MSIGGGLLAATLLSGLVVGRDSAVDLGWFGRTSGVALAVLAAVGLFLVALRLLTNRAVSLREVLPGASANVVLKRHRYPRALSRRRPPRSTGMSTAMNAPPRPVRRGRQTILTDRQTWIGGAMSHLTWCQVNCVSCGFVPRCAGSRGSMRALTDRAAAGAG